MRRDDEDAGSSWDDEPAANSGEDLYPPTPPPPRRSETSEEAAASIAEDTNRLRCLVLDMIRKSKGATCYEVEQALGLMHQTASPRIHELYYDLGKIVKSGQKRKTGSGRNAVVWVEKTAKSK